MNPDRRSQDTAGGDHYGGGVPLPPGTRVGDYEIAGVVGEGGFGIVYTASDQLHDRRVAVKEYMPGALADREADGRVVVRAPRHEPAFAAGMRSFINEARMLAAFDHPALVKVWSFWEQNGTAYMAMPLYEGRTFKAMLRETPKPTEAFLRQMLGPLLDALELLHRSECYHRDVSPDNIMLLADGSPVLLDFGAARKIIGNMTQDVTVILKPGFAPIEQYADDPSMRQGPWTDVYAVAAVLRLAISGKSPPAPITRIVSDTMKPLRGNALGYSARFLDGIDRGLAVRPENRPQTIAAFREALGMGGVGATAAAPVVAPDPVPRESLEATVIPAVPPAGAPGAAPARGHDLEETTRITFDPQLRERLQARPSMTAGPGAEPVVPAGPTPGSAEAGRRPISEPATTVSPHGQAKLRWAIGAGAVLIAAGLGWLFWGGNAPEPGPKVVAVAPAPLPVPPPRAESPPATTAPMSPATTATPGGSTNIPPATPAASPPIRTEVPAAATPATIPPVAAIPQPAAPESPPKPAPVVVKAGKVRFVVKPWGEIVVDGKSRGTSPPVKELTLPEGRHRIEIRNAGFRGYQGDVELKAGGSVVVSHTFQ